MWSFAPRNSDWYKHLYFFFTYHLHCLWMINMLLLWQLFGIKRHSASEKTFLFNIVRSSNSNMNKIRYKYGATVSQRRKNKIPNMDVYNKKKENNNIRLSICEILSLRFLFRRCHYQFNVPSQTTTTTKKTIIYSINYILICRYPL